MKRLVLLVALLVPWVLVAQKSPVDKLFEKYANQEGFTTVNISGKLLGIAGKLDSEDPEISKMLQGLTGIRILAVEDDNMNPKPNFYEELESSGFFKNNDYESLMEITEKDEVVRFYAKDAGNGKISELLMVIGGDDNTLISIRGLIDPENIGKITGALDIDISSDSMNFDINKGKEKSTGKK